ncbi:hypothetical protein [Flavobacterium sp. LB1P71]|uniref:hypothetical protein n=1 Tax=unclassified Flavobacterium TaxID=196869 RepID=UPI003AAA7397
MGKVFKLEKIETPYEFELDENGYVWLLDYELKGSKTNLGQLEGGIKDLNIAKKIALDMIASMGLI